MTEAPPPRSPTDGRAQLTLFGESLRAIRKKKGILLLDMAKIAGVSPGFLSLVETGKKPIPERLVPALASGLDLNAAEEGQLSHAAALSAREYKIRLEAGASTLDRHVAHRLQTGFAKMSKENKEQILKLLGEG